MSSHAHALVEVAGSVPDGPLHEILVDRDLAAHAACAFRDENHERAVGLAARLLRDHLPLPDVLASAPEPAVRTAPPPDLFLQPGPWDLFRDPRNPAVGDVVLLALRAMYARHAYGQVGDWVDVIRRRGAAPPNDILPELLVGAAYVSTNRLREGYTVFEELLRTHPDASPERRANLLHNLGLTLSQLGEFRRARELLAEAVTLSRISGETWQLGKILIGHALVEIRSFALREGETLLREAAGKLDASGQRVVANSARFNLAIALYKQARPAEALAVVDRVEPELLRAGQMLSWVQTRLTRCKTHLVAGRADAAEAIAVEIERKAAARAFLRETGLAVEMQGDAAVLRGDLAAARTFYDRAMAMADARAPVGDIAAGLRRRLGQVSLLEGDLDQACGRLRDAVLAGRTAGEAFEEVVSGRLLADCRRELGDPEAARAAAHDAVSRARTHGCEMELSRALLAEARAEAVLAAGGLGGDRETAWARAGAARQSAGRRGVPGHRDICDRFLARLREAWRSAWVWAGGPPPPESLDGGAEPAFVAASPVMVDAAGQMALAAASDDPLLITGETGTGKEVAARRVHGLGRRSRGPLVSVNCAAVPPDLFEREFFGHAPGAFTGAEQGARGLVEQAHRGTLFLDEVGDLPAGLQGKLLRLLQDGTFRRLGDPAEMHVDLRVIAATNVDLPQRVSSGTFRRDLFYRLCVLEVALPPLRDREGDVVALVRAFVRRGLGDGAEPEAALPGAVLAAMSRYDWPGNVRELEGLVRRACLFARMGKAMPTTMVPAGLREVMEAGEEEDASATESLNLDARMAVVERDVVTAALRSAAGNRAQAARLLGVSRKALYAKIRRLGLE